MQYPLKIYIKTKKQKQRKEGKQKMQVQTIFFWLLVWLKLQRNVFDRIRLVCRDLKQYTKELQNVKNLSASKNRESDIEGNQRTQFNRRKRLKTTLLMRIRNGKGRIDDAKKKRGRKKRQQLWIYPKTAGRRKGVKSTRIHPGIGCPKKQERTKREKEKTGLQT